jgi:hypothetical protein
MKRLANCLILLISLTFLAACGSDSTGPDKTGSGHLSGTYHVISIMGKSLPYVYIEEDDDYCDDVDWDQPYGTSTTTVTSFSITFDKHNTFAYDVRGKSKCVYADGRTTEESEDEFIIGEYEVDRNKLYLYSNYFLTDADGVAFEGTISGNNITIWHTWTPDVKIRLKK